LKGRLKPPPPKPMPGYAPAYISSARQKVSITGDDSIFAHGTSSVILHDLCADFSFATDNHNLYVLENVNVTSPS